MSSITIIGPECQTEIGPKREHLAKQIRDSKGKSPSITCECGFKLPLRFSYKCLYCGAWFCEECAGIHFGLSKSDREAMRTRLTVKEPQP